MSYVNSNASGCVEKDDTCPTGYYKTCETSTTGDPEYTEKGTACYQCKPKTSSAIKVVAYLSSNCPSGLTFDYTAGTYSTITCNSGCYLYDDVYFPDNCGAITNMTENIITTDTAVTISNLPSEIIGIKSMTTGKTYNISGSSYTFYPNTLDETSEATGCPYDFWTLQCAVCYQQSDVPWARAKYSDLSSDFISEANNKGYAVVDVGYNSTLCSTDSPMFNGALWGYELTSGSVPADSTGDTAGSLGYGDYLAITVDAGKVVNVYKGTGAMPTGSSIGLIIGTTIR